MCSVYFTRMTLWLEDRIKSVQRPFVRWAMAAGCLGLLIYLFPPLFGEGYEYLHELLNGGTIDLEGQTILAFCLRKAWLVPVFFMVVLLLKVFSMSFTNAGGGVGGTFGPTLFIGALAGFVVSRTINLIGGAPVVPEQNFVLVGMAGLMSGVMQAPMTAIFLIADMTGGYELLIPLIITSTVSYGVARSIEPYSIYTKRIAKKGELLTHDSDQAVLTLLKTDELIESDFTPESKIAVETKLVSDTTTLLQATLAGVGPDVALNIPKATIMNFAFRGAVEDLSKYTQTADMVSRFTESSMISVRYGDGSRYGLCIFQAPWARKM